jgi:hypothetical protein
MRAAMMKATHLLCMAVALAGCQKQPPVDPDAGNKAAMQKVLARMQQDLKDPESARFRSTTLHANDQNSALPWMAVCGEVNAKNSFGGYVGFRRFVAKQGGLDTIEIEPADGRGGAAFRAAWDTYCTTASKMYTSPPSP